MREHNIVEILYKGLAILNTLLAYAGKKVTRRELADKTGLSPKQVGRYLNTLEALHVPLKRQQRGTEELVSLERDVRKPLRLLPFTTEELTAIAFYTTLSPSVHDTTPLGSLHTVGQKIATFLQADHQHDAQFGEAFLPFAKHYKVYSTPQTQKVLQSLIPALLESRVCQVTYQTPLAERATTYAIHPYTLCLHHGGLYLFAYRPDTDVLTVLSVERMSSISVEPCAFTRDPDMLQRIEARRQRAFGIIDDGGDLAVVLKFTAAQAPYVRERIWHPSQHLQAQPDGSLILRFQASGAFEIRRWILGWGNQVEVLAPPELRQQIAQSLQAAARRYTEPAQSVVSG
jgi:proteasome accessory factor B